MYPCWTQLFRQKTSHARSLQSLRHWASRNLLNWSYQLLRILWHFRKWLVEVGYFPQTSKAFIMFRIIMVHFRRKIQINQYSISSIHNKRIITPIKRLNNLSKPQLEIHDINWCPIRPHLDSKRMLNYLCLRICHPGLTVHSFLRYHHPTLFQK